MNIIFEKIVLENFMSFEHACLDFENYQGYTLIKGQNNNELDNATSNGSGKSTIWEALVWCLTGQTLRGNKNVVRQGQSKCSVELQFRIDTNEYVITREKGDSSNLFIYINGENKSGKGIRDSEKLLAEYLPDVTGQLINSVIILGQGLPERFTNNSPSGRKEVLEKLSKSDFMIEDLKERIDRRTKTLSQELRSYEDKSLQISSQTNIYRKQLEKAKLDLENLPGVEELSETISEQKTYVDKLKTDIKNLTTTSDTMNSDMSDLHATMTRLQQEANDHINQCQIDINNDEELKELKNTKYDVDIRIGQLDAYIKKAKSIKDVCPTCGQKLPNVSVIDTTKESEELEELKKLQKELLEKIQKIDTKHQEILRDARNHNSAEIAECTSNINQLSAKTAATQTTIRNLTNELQSEEFKLSTNEKTLLEFSSRKDTLNSMIKEAEENIQKCELELTEVSEKVQKLKLHSDVVTKFSTIVKRDFRGYLLSNIINYIDYKAKEYCEYIFHTSNISFELDGNNISISYNGKEYEALSGGERQKIDLIVQFSIRDMLCKYLNFNANILVLDEITDNLDDKGCNNIIDFISNVLNVNCIYIISHRADSLSIPCDNELLIIKDKDGVSTLK